MLKSPKLARASAIAVRVLFFGFGAFLSWRSALDGRLPRFEWLLVIETLFFVPTMCLIWVAVSRLVDRFTDWGKTLFLSRGSDLELSWILAANYLGLTAGLLLAATAGQRNALAFIPATIAGIIAAFGSMAIISKLFGDRVPAR